MANSFSISEAQLVSSWVATVFWAFFLVTFGKCLRTLLLNEWGTEFRRPSQIRWLMVAVSASFFVIGTLDIVLGFYHNAVTFLMQTLIGDGVLIFRLWVVYARSWKVMPIPLFLWLGAAACAGGMIFGEISTVTGTVGSSKVKDFIIPFLTCSITVNIVATGLLVYPIVKVDRQNSENGVLTIGNYFLAPNIKKKRSRLQRLIFIIIESGLMYTTTAFITFISMFISNSNASYTTSDVEVQVVGIAFNLIIIRVADRGEKDKSLYTIQDQLRVQSILAFDSGPLSTDQEKDSSPAVQIQQKIEQYDFEESAV
ncbi:hypothetical protein GALMADRAFT_215508 [Galerina marginata CBS 339.88]|uniref:Uncharacterized protein n=1 Tax=Galerina marginata (strain CBS 339.88) TaxID=685588 RepID=A0A067SG40_GALM3|nr:hypothetical protein GALMADRAFT_215508 [Galerina marginata CBS 339.88]